MVECKKCGKQMHEDSDAGMHDGLSPPTCNSCRNQPDPNENVWVTRRSPCHQTQDLHMVRSLIRKHPQRFKELGDKTRAQLVEFIQSVLEDTNAPRRDRMNAAKVLLEVDKLNLDDEQLRDKQSRLDAGTPTDIVHDPYRREIEVNAIIAELAQVTGEDPRRLAQDSRLIEADPTPDPEFADRSGVGAREQEAD